MGFNMMEQKKLKSIRLRLGDILRERDMSQADFSRLSGLSKNAVCILVNQPTQIRIETLETICTTLHIYPGELFELI